MSVCYYKSPSNDICGICHDTLKNSVSAVAHSKPGVKYIDPKVTKELMHPMHLGCIQEWAKIRSKCPYCQGSIQLSSLFSLKDRAITEMKKMSKDAFNGAVVGVTFPLLAASLINLSKLIINEHSGILAAAVLGTFLVCNPNARAAVEAIGRRAAYYSMLAGLIGMSGVLTANQVRSANLGFEALTLGMIGAGALAGSVTAVCARRFFRQ